MLIYFLAFYEYAFPLFLIYSFDNDDMKSSKRHVILLSLIFLLKCLSKSFFIRNNIDYKNQMCVQQQLKICSEISINHHEFDIAMTSCTC